ncbi:MULTISPECIES: WD40 repeat domain-containing protein [unclassified Endozoicomonas]|uniref:WD40 repeat domain-containing protein n=1 Tax=unclassified Endozoicomonas TaxID=2644528 RepID=UPI003BB551E8
MKSYWRKMINCSVLAGLSCVAITGLNADTSAQEPPKKVDIELALEMNANPPAEFVNPYDGQSSKCNVHSTSWNHDASWLAAGVSCKHKHISNTAHVQLLQKDTLIRLYIRIPSGENFDKVNAVFSPDGSLLAVSTNEKVIRFYDAHKGFILKHVHELDDNFRPNPPFSFNSDGSLFAVARSHDVKVYSLKGDFLHTGTINNIEPVEMTFTSDKNILAVKTFSQIKTFHSNDEFATSEVVKTSKMKKRRFYRGFASSPDGYLLAAPTAFGGIRFIDNRTCQPGDPYQTSFTPMISEEYSPCSGNSMFNQDIVYLDTSFTTSMAFNNDGSLLVVGGSDINDGSGYVSVLSKQGYGWSIEHSIKDPKSTVNSVSFSPDGELMAVAGVEGKIWLYEINPVEDNSDEVNQEEVNLVNKSTTPEPSNLTTEYSMCTIFGHCK